MTSLKLWLGITDEHKNLELWLGLVSVIGGSVLVVANTDGSRWIALLSVLLTSLVVLGRYRLCSYLGTPSDVAVCDPWHDFRTCSIDCGQ
ncbi:hypothetical protein DEO72_LG7g1440 [Vigna unguiculata]|uniref:Uncharacterized protein n=1 Tax=Vigna unguiculata TaxID=3917 RepID=A0A4D6MFE2_VIGUN|nr:hypothetical protein DEO72_LG7g1440 [Vigna unguiculata]